MPKTNTKTKGTACSTSIHHTNVVEGLLFFFVFISFVRFFFTFYFLYFSFLPYKQRFCTHIHKEKYIYIYKRERDALKNYPSTF